LLVRQHIEFAFIPDESSGSRQAFRHAGAVGDQIDRAVFDSDYQPEGIFSSSERSAEQIDRKQTPFYEAAD
jgi:hypothetical protein